MGHAVRDLDQLAQVGWEAQQRSDHRAQRRGGLEHDARHLEARRLAARTASRPVRSARRWSSAHPRARTTRRSCPCRERAGCPRRCPRRGRASFPCRGTSWRVACPCWSARSCSRPRSGRSGRRRRPAGRSRSAPRARSAPRPPRERGTSSRRSTRANPGRRAGSPRRRRRRGCCRSSPPWRRRGSARPRRPPPRPAPAWCRRRWPRASRAAPTWGCRPCRPRRRGRRTRHPRSRGEWPPSEVRSPSTSSQSSRRRSPALVGLRTSATTSSPRSRSLRATWPPMNPVAPVTNALTRRLYPLCECTSTATAYETRRARQRALLIAAGPEEADLTELRELLRTAGVAVAGELTQKRGAARSRPLLREGQAGRAEASGEGCGREPRRLRRRAAAAAGAEPRGGARRAGDRPHGDHPRHLRRPCGLGRGQAPGRAGAARVQPGTHARAVDPSRAARRGHHRRHRHEGPRRDADRDRPEAGPGPHRRAQAAAASTRARRAA